MKLGTIPVTVLSGAPSVHFGTSTPIDPFGFGTGFGTDCQASIYPNTYVLAAPGDPAGDWFDTDGAAAPAGTNMPPSLSASAAVTAAAASPVTISATATDPDAGDVLTITETGAPGSLTFVASPGPSPATATLNGTPTFLDAAGSPYTISWAVNDGVGGNAAATSVSQGYYLPPIPVAFRTHGTAGGTRSPAPACIPALTSRSRIGYAPRLELDQRQG